MYLKCFKNSLQQCFTVLSGIRSKQSGLLFKTSSIVETRNFIPLKPDWNFSSSVNLFEDPSAFNTFPVIFDTGASLAITNSKEEFAKPPQPLHMPLFLGGMTDGLEVMGIPEISCTFVASDNTEVTDGY